MALRSFHRSVFLLLAAAVVVPAAAVAATPVVGLHGILRTAAGTAVPDGEYAMAVALYAAAEGGDAIFEETFLAVQVEGGFFAIELGAKKEPLPAGLLDGSPRFFGVTVGGNPELPRAQLLEVPYAVHARTAAAAATLVCSGCVSGTEIAAATITADHLAVNAVEDKHVAFTYAASKSKGGPAESALIADKAALAVFATNAGVATSADEAKSADVAAKLQCTGCVTAAMVATGATADLVAAKELAAVAVSGKYSDLEGGPDLSGYAALAIANSWVEKQTFAGGVDHGQDANFAKHQALLFRFQNSEGPPAVCDASVAGMTYFDPKAMDLVVCNGSGWVAYAHVGDVGSQGNPVASCKALLESGQKVDGVYWLKTGGVEFQAYCDLTGGGWTLAMKLSDASKYIYADAVWTQADASGGLPMPDANADAVNRAFYKLTATETRVCMKAYGTGKVVCETISHGASTARDLAAGPILPSTQATKGKLTDNWRSIVPGGAWSANAWHRFGWNNGTEGCGGLRLGFSADNDSSDSRDSGIGLGVYKGGCSSDLKTGSGYWHYPGWNPKPSPLAAGLEGYVWMR